MKKPLIFAHRGVKGTHPENTIAAFQEAARVGADGIELDVHASKDGELVVIHDETIDRTTNGTGFVTQYTLAELQTFDAGSFFSSEFSNESIPSLRSVLEWLMTNDLLVNIELKNDVIRYPELEQKAIQLVREHKLANRTIFSSFNHDSVELLASLAPDIKRAILYYEPLKNAMEEAARRHADGLHPNYELLTRSFVKEAQAAGYTLRPYTINSYEDLETMMEYGVDVIITDWPMRAFDILSRKGLR